MRAPYTYAPSPCPGRELPPFGGNAQLGCGLVVREIKGHRYLYFWSYEPKSWGTYRRWTYVGRVGRTRTRARASELLLSYRVRVRKEVDRRIERLTAIGLRGT